MTADPLIRVTGLTKVFGNALILDGVTIEVKAGEAVALLGANGAGKTTLLKVLATITRPTRGSATVAGHDCVRDAEGVRRHVGLIAHGSYLYEDLTAIENLRFWSAFAGRDARDAALQAALTDVELDAFADERVRSFSAGMKRRLALARVAMLEPTVLLLDEPFSALDQRARKWLEEYLGSFKDRGGAVMMATHSFSRDLQITDRVAILAAGKIALDTPRSAVSPDELRRLYALHTEDLA
ncbi:MAG: heme ABC exporter ATP-binding protein CcmA [Candidatus Rokubacteria bacterium]|nr:heme ABC exporter ATP-binding protein CcmA [Candidatus Rokubacteria bacterium]